MALTDRLRALPWYVQAFVVFLVFAGVVVLGEMLAISPVKGAIEERTRLSQEYQTLVADVNKLRAVEQQHSEFRTRVQALEEQLARLQTFVPSEKQTDEFIHVLQSSALNAQISVRRLTSKAVVMKEFYAEMPFEVELDGPYYNLMEFYSRLGRTTRIVNAGTLKMQGIDPTKSPKYEYIPGTSVAGVCMVTTFYTPSEAELAAAAPPPTRGAPARR